MNTSVNRLTHGLNTILVLLFASATPAFGQAAHNARPLTAQPNEKWVIRWNRSDDFNGDQVDWRKWQKTPENFGAWTWNNASNASVVDGLLTVIARHLPEDTHPLPTDRFGQSTPYTSGMLKSYASGTYGYYEARIKGAALFPGLCPAFWLYSRIDDALIDEGSVRYSEIDIVELTQRGNRIQGNEKITDHNLHAILSNGKPGIPGRQWLRPNDKRYQAQQASEYHAPFDPREDFHTYGCRVGRDEIVWYVDGVEVGRKANHHWHRNTHVALSLGFRAPFSVFANNRLTANTQQSADELPASMTVDYVRVWEHQE